MEALKEKKCFDLVEDRFNSREKTFKEAKQYYDWLESESFTEINNDYHGYEDYYHWLSEYGLSFDYVEPGTFNDQETGYFRYQLSWGGPSDEFRIYLNYDGLIDHIEYWYLDWYDGASIKISFDSESYNVCAGLLDVDPLYVGGDYEN